MITNNDIFGKQYIVSKQYILFFISRLLQLKVFLWALLVFPKMFACMEKTLYAFSVYEVKDHRVVNTIFHPVM